MAQIVMALCTITMPTDEIFFVFEKHHKKQSYFILLGDVRGGMVVVCNRREARLLVILSQSLG
jgi:hypothetical protein